MSSEDQILEKSLIFGRAVKVFNQLWAEIDALPNPSGGQAELDQIKQQGLEAGSTVTQRLEDDAESEALDHASAQFDRATELINDAIQKLRAVIAKRRNP